MKKAILLLLLVVLPLSHSLPQQDKGFVPDNVTSLGSAGTGFKFENQYAFIIGINDYNYLNPLNNCVRDAQSVENILKSTYGFRETKIKTLYNGEATYDAVTEKLRDYIRVMTEKDSLFIYFSGHGFLDELLSETSWLPVNVGEDVAGIKTLKNQKAFKKICEKSSKKISGELVVKFLKNCRARHIFVVADSCFSSRFLADMKNTARALPAAEKFALRSRQVLTSGRGLVSDGKRGTHSPFATFFMQYLKKERKGYISAGALMAYVQDVVPNNSNPRQLPLGRPVIGTGDEGGDFYFVPVSMNLIMPDTGTVADSGTDPGTDDKLLDIYQEVERKRLKVVKEKNDWNRKQARLKKRFDIAEKIDKSDFATADEKFKAWATVLKEFDKDNPYTESDDMFKEEVILNLKKWGEEIKYSNKLIRINNFPELRKLSENAFIVCYYGDEICKIISIKDLYAGVLWAPSHCGTVELKNSVYAGKRYDIIEGYLNVGDPPAKQLDEKNNVALTTIVIKNQQILRGAIDIEDDLGNKYSYPVDDGDYEIQVLGSRVKKAEIVNYDKRERRYRVEVLENGRAVEIKCVAERKKYKIHFYPTGIDKESLPQFWTEGELDEKGRPMSRSFSADHESSVFVYVPCGKTPEFTIRDSPRFEDTDGRLEGKNVYFDLKPRKNALAVVVVFNSNKTGRAKNKLMAMLKEVRKKRKDFKLLLTGDVKENARVWEFEKVLYGGKAKTNLPSKTIGSLEDVFEMITANVRKEFARVNFTYDLEAEVPNNKIIQDDLLIILDRKSRPDYYFWEFFTGEDVKALNINIIDFREVLKDDSILEYFEKMVK